MGCVCVGGGGGGGGASPYKALTEKQLNGGLHYFLWRIENYVQNR